MTVKKIPMRTCVVTKEQRPKQDLVRVVATKEGLVSVDLTGKANGRGAYLTLEKSVIEKAIKTKALDKKLEVTIANEIYQELLELAKNAK